jgi:AraC-like DNA-binding protein
MPDQALFLEPNVRHRGTCQYPDGLVFYWLHFYMDESDGGQEVPLYTTLARPNVMVELMRRFLDDQQSGRLETTPFKGTLHLLLMLEEIAGNHMDTSSLPGVTVALAGRADEIVSSRYMQDLSTSAIAAELGCHSDHLGRVYRQVFGRPLTEALNRRRVDRAAQQLIESSVSIDEIGYKVGFKDRGYFRRLFRRYRQTTPSAFRRLHTRVHLNS